MVDLNNVCLNLVPHSFNSFTPPPPERETRILTFRELTINSKFQTFRKNIKLKKRRNKGLEAWKTLKIQQKWQDIGPRNSIQ